ncbi:MAG: PepSY-like domain-containing protein [Planctomycetia bacterium]|nr:PepSY-like domain-containing protein [Planctomycetia bacterium]
MRHDLTRSLLVCIVLAISVADALAAAEKVSLDKLPKAVSAALKSKFPDAKLTSAEKETVDGKTVFNVALNFKDHDHDVRLTDDGKITRTGKAISGRDLPTKVAKALIDKYPRGTNKKVVEVTTDKAVTYEILLLTGDQRLLDLQVDSDGKVLKETERKEEKKP